MTPSPLPLTRFLLLFLAVCLSFGSRIVAQTHFSDNSLLSNPTYVEQAIREIADEQLWAAVDLGRPGLEDVRAFVQNGEFERAAAAWGTYWVCGNRPRFVSAMDHLVIDTDILMSPASFRKAMQNSPEERDTILARADEILGNRINTWGSNVVDFGAQVDFNKPMGQSEIYGFHYWVWSRPLLMASVMTGDEKYLGKFDELFNRWYDQRNSIARGFPEFDVVYYELGLGLRSRAFVEDYLLPFPERTARSHARMLKTLLAAGRWLYELEKWEGYRAGNWQIHGAYTLTLLSLVIPEFRESREWRRIGLQRMLEHLERDFFSDGGHSERSPRNYTMSTYLTFRNLAYLLSVYNVEHEAAERIRSSMARTMDWWMSIITPTGEIPAVNDSYRGLFPQRILHDAESLLGHAPVQQHASKHMPASGFTVMRSDSTSNALYLLIQYGPFAGFHSHFDLLDFELYAYGRALAVDAGVGTTYDDPLYPDWYRSSRAHNMVTVNDSSIKREGFQGENILWGSTPTVDFFSGEQNGYRRFGVKQRRQIAFVKRSYWFVLDDLDCKHDNDTLSWYFHSPTTLLPTGDGLASSSGPGIQVIPVGARYNIVYGTGVAASSTVRVPGKTEKINWARFDQRSIAGTHTQFPIVLFPFQTQRHSLRTEKLSPRHYLVENAGYSDDLYFAHGAYTDDTVQTDGSFVLIRKTAPEGSSYVIINGSYLSYKGRTVFRSDSAGSFEGKLP
jgi:hypothetical protein